MAFSVFQHLLRAERYLPPKGRRGDFQHPALMEVNIRPGQDPLLATNARGAFVSTRTSSIGTARYGFSPCSFDEEPRLIQALYECLSTQQQWSLRCSGVQAAVDRLLGLGLEAKTIVVSSADAAEMLGTTGTVPEGVAGVVRGMKVLVTDLPKGAALVAVAPEHLGICTRVGEHLGLLFQRLDQNVMVVDVMAR